MTSPIYDEIGKSYTRHRRVDPRIAAAIHAALGDAATVLNVGAGAGSYEPSDRQVVALEPSAVMLSQRAPQLAPAVQGCAEALPFADASFDAVLGVLTLHHWTTLADGLRECARVARRRVVFFTWDPAGPGFWLTQHYLPHFLARDRRRFPSIGALRTAVGERARVTAEPVPIPSDCIDGFLGAYWARPAAYLDEAIRGSISSFAGAEAGEGLAQLAVDLADGTWEARFGHLRAHASLDIGYRVVTIEGLARDLSA